ncbi:hypothetical protein J2D73_10930 [Acetobacter sacchari]|uniref:Uncharacterized protein n=1 Tax=Acetobacter sacchari TaxID=2661687 RepID=A0ABS3LWQ6_9PROT|nr:hypothetical protein [Acetobacter sacchari]MBO1360301.1 hypothetical protein [Acetobacter sacchari]
MDEAFRAFMAGYKAGKNGDDFSEIADHVPDVDWRGFYDECEAGFLLGQMARERTA